LCTFEGTAKRIGVRKEEGNNDDGLAFFFSRHRPSLLFYNKEMAMAIVSRQSTNIIREPMLALWLRAAPWLEHVLFDVYLYGVGQSMIMMDLHSLITML
jgi:hypothetical protein